ncbi:hypothetical protein DSO57_1038701 [Entomophthora muscae]|uniref:Uncharacterized protein n=1 Tax=Entomophthora muscae TaxID=34485 RepID=A0ACC2RPS1_9FUNG|nr:hypothetical protein DSO57_1038701 [Entomophthora muscae]
MPSPEASKLHPNYYKIEEINNKLKNGSGTEVDTLTAPSPEPIFNADGKQINTREILFRKRLEEERQLLIEQALADDPDFKPPLDHKKTPKLQEKYFIPAKEHPEINFIGLLIGPRGHTLKRMELESGTKISIRGKGSVKEGKRTDVSAGPEEELHCLISGDSPQKIKKAKKLIEKIIETSSSVPEGQNELKRQQLRELAALNGTLRDDENQPCSQCGFIGHRKFECPDFKNIAKALCTPNSALALSSSLCASSKGFSPLDSVAQRDHQLNNEILSLVGELDEAPLLTSERAIPQQSSNLPAPLTMLETSISNWSSTHSTAPTTEWTLPATTFSSIPGTYSADAGFSDTAVWASISASTPFSETSQIGMGFLFNPGISQAGATNFQLTSQKSEAFVPPEPPSHPPPPPPPPPSTNEPILPWVSLNGNSPFEELPPSLHL